MKTRGLGETSWLDTKTSIDPCPDVMMSIKIRENAFFWLLAVAAVIALFAGATADEEPEGFFIGVRAVVCFASVFAAVKAYKAKRDTWAWLLGANAALYNPFVLVHLTRDMWQLLDWADIILVIAAALVLRGVPPVGLLDDDRNRPTNG